VSGDDRSWVDREKRSFSELDRQRRERRPSDEHRPRGKAAQERTEAATKQYIKDIGGLFSQRKKAEFEQITTAMRDAHGTPGLADACRIYHQAAGLPGEASLISLFLDTGDPEMTLVGLEALRSGHENGTVKVTSGLRSQLRILSEDADDEVAEAAEELLNAL
jgi:hypothetical protein